MSKYILRRLLLVPVLLFGITFLDFLFINLAPGDPVQAMTDPESMAQMSQEYIEARRHQLGLDQPIVIRYVFWLNEIVHGNLGYSISRQRPVAELMLRAWQNTIILMLMSLAISTLTGIALGVAAAVKRYSFGDYTLAVLAFVGVGLPNFFLAMLLIYVFGLRLGWLPTSGISSPLDVEYPIIDRLRHMALPVAALSFNGIGSMLRYARSSMIEVLNQDYITVARAKGLRERAVILRHALKNGFLPIVTILGLTLPSSLVGGSFIVESMFNYPGMGYFLVDATMQRDYPVMMGGLLVAAVLVLFTNLLTDIAYAWVDPRIRYD